MTDPGPRTEEDWEDLIASGPPVEDELADLRAAFNAAIDAQEYASQAV